MLPRRICGFILDSLVEACSSFLVCSAWRLAHLYQASVLVLAAYSVLYGLTARKARWLGGVTSAAVIILGKLSVYYQYVFLVVC